LKRGARKRRTGRVDHHRRSSTVSSARLQDADKNLRRGAPPRRKGQLNAATLEIKALASRLLVEDEEWIESARPG
jgi:hypothetical protein